MVIIMVSCGESVLKKMVFDIWINIFIHLENWPWIAGLVVSSGFHLNALKRKMWWTNNLANWQYKIWALHFTHTLWGLLGLNAKQTFGLVWFVKIWQLENKFDPDDVPTVLAASQRCVRSVCACFCVAAQPLTDLTPHSHSSFCCFPQALLLFPITSVSLWNNCSD